MNITYNSIDDKFFYEMQKEELLEAIDAIDKCIKSYTKSISDQERQTELWEAYQNCNYNLNKF